MRARLSSCADYDPNICTFKTDPANVAKIVIKAGQPFLKKIHYEKESLTVRLRASDDFIQVSLPFEFELESMSINRADEIYSLKFVGEFQFGEKQYPVFARRGTLNGLHGAFLCEFAFQKFVGALSVDAKESIHVYGNGLRVYLHRPTSDLVFQVVDSALAFLKRLTPSRQELDLSSLPPRFAPLIRLIRHLGMIDETEAVAEFVAESVLQLNNET